MLKSLKLFYKGIQTVLFVALICGFSVVKVLAAKPQEGKIYHRDGRIEKGKIWYKNYAVGKKIHFLPKEDSSKAAKKSVYSPEELLGFEYGSEIWRRVTFEPKDIGWQESFFMRVESSIQDIELLVGKISMEGCHCSGTKKDFEKKAVLLHINSGHKQIIDRSKYGRIRHLEWIWAFFDSYSLDAFGQKFKTLKDLIAFMSAN